MRLGAALAAVVALALASHAASADDDEALAAMRRGVAAFGRGDGEAALREYDAAKRAAPLANMPYRYAAEALLSMRRYREAVEGLEGYLAKKPDVGDAPDVRLQIARIRAEHFPARARIATNVPSAEVVIDGESRGALTVLETTPGKHYVELRAPGYEAASQSVTLVGDEEASLSFTLAASAPLEPPPPIVAPPRGTDPWRIVGWSAVGVGAAALLTGLVVDVAILGPKISDYRDAADRGDPSARGLRDDATGLRTAAVVGYAAGAILVAGGGALLFFNPRSNAAGAGRATFIRPWVAADTAGFAASGTF